MTLGLASLAWCGLMTGCPSWGSDDGWDSCATCQDDGDEWGDGDGDGDGDYESFFGEVHLNNAGSDDAFVQLRQLRSSISLDCYEVAKDPGALLPSSAFEEAVSWRLPPWTNVAAGLVSGARDCHAVIVNGQSVEPTLLFWNRGAPDQHLLPGQYGPGDSPVVGAVVMNRPSGEFVSYEDVGGQWHYEPKASPELPDECLPPGDGARLVHTGLDTTGTFNLVDAQWGPDGCARLATVGLEDWQNENAVPTENYLCMDEALFPLQPGDWFSNAAAAGNSVDGAYSARSITRLGDDLLPTSPEVVLIVSRFGNGLPEIGGTEFVVRETFGCEFARDEGCAEVSRALYLQSLDLDEVVQLDVGAAPVTFAPDPTTEVSMQLMYGRRRIVLDDACAEGSSQMGDDLEVAAVVRHY